MIDPPVLRQALRLLRREFRGGLRGFGVFLSCLFLGVFSITAIGSFTAAARTGLLADASALLGGDLEVRQVHRPLDSAQLAALSRLGTVSKILTLRTMAAGVEGGTRALVELKAVDHDYPLFGRLPLSPEQSLEPALAFQDGRFGALVEKSFLQRFDLTLGDQVQVGGVRFTLRGILKAEPDRSIRPFYLGPRLMISAAGLAATDLVQPGSLVDYSYRVKLPDRTQAEILKAELQKMFPDAGWRIRTWREAAPRVRYFLDRMSTNLTLFGLCALLVGGLGVTGAVRGYLSGKVLHIAAMKCLGASGRLIFVAYLLQVLLLGTIGAGAGLLLGSTVPFLIHGIWQEALPIPLQPAIFPQVLSRAALFGVLIALLFSLKELGIACQVPAAVLFRGYTETGRKNPGRKIWLAIGFTMLLLAVLAYLSSDDRRLAFWFIVGAGFCFLLFRFLAILVIRGVRYLPRPANPWLRLGMTSIFRPGSPAGSVLFSLGLGLTALVLIALVQANLNDMVSETIPAEAPAYFFLDLQPQQVATFEKILAGFPELQRVERFPTLRGRITAIDGVPVDQVKIAPEVRWAVRGDRFLSYSATMPEGTELSAGQWWPTDYRGAAKISLTADLAKGFGIGLGDTLTVNILGREVTAEISSLRNVDWTTLKLNFAILFSPGVLEAAPHTDLAAVYLPESREEALYQAVTSGIPNLSAISTREVLSNVARTLGRIGAAFKGMAAIALLTGFLVLAGAVSADQHRRIQDAVIFKVCGATRRDILLAFVSEFILLGLAASVISGLVGSLAALAILKGPLDVPFSFHPLVVLGTLLAGVGLTLVLGLLGTWKALGQKPAAYLRGA